MKMKKNYSAWSWDIRSCSPSWSIQEKIKFFLQAGILAPSLHNTQPWLFRIHDNVVNVMPDWNRQLKRADPEGHHILTSIGCCITNIETAAAYFGFSVSVRMLDDEEKTTGVQLTFSPSKHPDKFLRTLCPFIPKRYSDKLTYLPTPVAPEILSSIQHMQVDTLQAYTTDDAASIQEIAALQNEAVILDVRGHGFASELATWLKPNNTHDPDGMPGFVAGLPPPIAVAGKYFLPHLKVSGVILGKKDRESILTSPAVGVIVGAGTDDIDYINVGRLYERIALFLRSQDISSAPMHSIVFYEKAQRFFARLFCYTDKNPRFFFRMGISQKKPYHTPRRLLDDVLESQDTERSLAKIVKTPLAIHSLSIRNYTIRYVSAGSGTPLILLHGGNIGWGQWYPNIAAFAKYFHVYAFDFPGGGRSSRVNFQSMNLTHDLVDVIDEAIQKLHIVKPHIVGSSIGGWVAMKLALKRGPKIGKLVLADAIGFTRKLSPMERIVGIPAIAGLMAKTMLKPVRSNKNLEMFMRSVFFDVNFPFPQEFIEYYYETMQTSHNLLFISRLSGLSGVPKELSILNDLPNLTNETLIVWGENDKLMKIRDVKAAFPYIPNGHVHIIKDAGHIVTIEKSEEFNKRALDFLRKK